MSALDSSFEFADATEPDTGLMGVDSGSTVMADTGKSMEDAGMSMMPDAGDPPPPGPLVDPDCIDGQYSETIPMAGADLSAPIQNYSSLRWRQYVEDVLNLRYPLGWAIVRSTGKPYVAW